MQTTASITSPSRPSIGYLAACVFVPLVLVLGFDVAGWDLAIARWYGSGSGFAWKDHVLLTQVFHVGIRRACVLIALYCVIAIWLPLGPWRKMSQRERIWLACHIWLCAIGVASLKSASLTSCPWDLAEFGHTAQYVWHFSWPLQWQPGTNTDGGSGRCFPSGHASSFFSFLPLVWVVHRRSARRAWQVLAALCVFGFSMSWIQVMRGAHYPSHVLWTLWLCWAAGTIGSPLLEPQRAAKPQSLQRESF